MDPAGDATIVWRRFDGTRLHRAVRRQACGQLMGNPASLSEAGQDASEPHVGVDAAGDATSVWRRFSGSDYVMQASAKPVGKPWGTPATLSEAARETSNRNSPSTPRAMRRPSGRATTASTPAV